MDNELLFTCNKKALIQRIKQANIIDSYTKHFKKPDRFTHRGEIPIKEVREKTIEYISTFVKHAEFDIQIIRDEHTRTTRISIWDVRPKKDIFLRIFQEG